MVEILISGCYHWIIYNSLLKHVYYMNIGQWISCNVIVYVAKAISNTFIKLKISEQNPNRLIVLNCWSTITFIIRLQTTWTMVYEHLITIKILTRFELAFSSPLIHQVVSYMYFSFVCVTGEIFWFELASMSPRRPHQVC